MKLFGATNYSYKNMAKKEIQFTLVKDEQDEERYCLLDTRTPYQPKRQ